MKELDLEKIDYQSMLASLKNINASSIASKAQLEFFAKNLFAVGISIDEIVTWTADSRFFNENSIRSLLLETSNQSLLNSKKSKIDMDKILKWFVETFQFKTDVTVRKDPDGYPYLIDCLDYDRYIEIFYNGGTIYNIFKNNPKEIQKEKGNSGFWQEVRSHIRPEVKRSILVKKLKNFDPKAIEKNIKETYDEIDAETFKKIFKGIVDKMIENQKVKISLTDFHIQTKLIENKIQPTKFNDLDGEYNKFKAGLAEKLKFTTIVDQCPPEFEKLLDNLAGQREKVWLINHMADYLQNFMSGWKLHRKNECLPLFYGNQGTGKNTLMELFAKLISEDGLCEISRNQFASQFNEWRNSAVILLNEFGKTNQDKRDFSNDLKLLTSPTFQINEKHLGLKQRDNQAYIALAANESQYGTLTVEETDRRIQYISGGKNIGVKKAAELNTKIFNRDQLDKELADFCNYLLNYKVDFELAETVFDNQPKLDDKELSASTVDKAIDLWLEENPDRNSVQTIEIVQFAKNMNFQNVNGANVGRRLKARFGESHSMKSCEYLVYGQLMTKHCNGYKVR